MLLCRFNKTRLGVVLGGRVIDVTPVLNELPAYRYPLPSYDPLMASLDRLKGAIERTAGGQSGVPLADVRLKSPVANPSKIIAAPVNYQDHIDEALRDRSLHNNMHLNFNIREAGLFLKAPGSLIGPSDVIRIRHPERRTDHEIELAVVIGKIADRVPAGSALDHVAGYSIGLDITVRGTEERSMRKSVDTYSVLGPWLATPDELTNPANLDFELSVNGETRQRSNTSNLVMAVPELIAFASSFYTLMPGDILMTGTPAGVGPIKAGDRIRASIAGIGEMTTNVAAMPNR